MLQGCLGFQWKSLLSNLCKLVSLLPQSRFFFWQRRKENNGKSSFVGLKCILNIISASRSKATLCSSLKSACLLERKSLSAEDVSCPRRQPADALRGWWVHWGGGGIKGVRMAPVAPTLHQCNYLTPGQRMEKKWQKLFLLSSSSSLSLLMLSFFFSSFLYFLTLKSKLKKIPLAASAAAGPRFHRSSQPELTGCLDVCCICHDQSAIRGKIRATSHWKLADSVLPRENYH